MKEKPVERFRETVTTQTVRVKFKPNRTAVDGK